MKGLLLKDFYVLKRQMKVFLAMYAIFAICPYYYFQLFAVLYTVMLPYTTLAYDEQSHWDTLAGMMPYSVRDLVLSKYLLSWIAVAATALLEIAAGILERPFFEQAARPEAVFIAVCIALLAIALSLPLQFRFGSARGRQIMTIGIVVIVCSCVGFLSTIMRDGTFAPAPIVLLLLALAALALTAVSVPVSMAFYRRKRL